MDNNNLEKFSDRKVGGKQLIAPIIAIVALLLVVGGVSYAYFGAQMNVSDNTIYANTTTPAAVAKSCSITKTDCNFTVNMNTMYKSLNSTTAKNTGTCDVTINCTGAASDKCTYDVELVNATTTDVYTRSCKRCNASLNSTTGTKCAPLSGYSTGVNNVVKNINPNDTCSALPYTDGGTTYNFEYSGTLYQTSTSGTVLKAETQMDSLAGTKLLTGQTLTIANSGAAVEKKYVLQTKFYNISKDQRGLLSDSGSVTYQHKLKITNLNCDWNH